MSRVAIILALFVFVSSASAQVIYEPVQYQYTAGGTTYFYGGHDPAVHHMAAEPHSSSGTWGRVDGYAFASATREVATEPARVYTDALPRVNGHNFGFTADDARNEAYNNVPRYFRKSDQLKSAVVKDGVRVVSAQAPTVRVFKSDGTEIHKAPVTMPQPLMIIPKDQLIKPNPKPSDKQLVSAE